MQIADPLKNIAARYEEIRKSHAEYAVKLERERDMSYSELKKIKGRYDGACQEVENRRKKIESSFDHGKQKAQTAYHQQVADMRNVKVKASEESGLRAWIDISRIRTSSASMLQTSRKRDIIMSTFPTC